MHPNLKRTVLSAIVLTLLTASLCLGAQARVLKRGMQGSDVLALQELLVELGYVLALDGIFGKETESLVREIQGAVGLVTDGIVGPQTKKMLSTLRQHVVSYTVESGDNLTKLANRYDTTVRDISSYNGLPNPDRLLPGQVLYIPTTALAATSRVQDARLNFVWPLQGRISSAYGYRIHPILNARHFHGGIDIAAHEGTPVKAAAAGRVIRAGNMGNYGLGVVLQHSGGFTSWYGHNSKLLVRVGDVVRQGQIIAQVGHTGWATGSHLDFRIKIGDQTVDPLQWLP